MKSASVMVVVVVVVVAVVVLVEVEMVVHVLLWRDVIIPTVHEQKKREKTGRGVLAIFKLVQDPLMTQAKRPQS